MSEQRQKLEVLYRNDSIEEQNRIVRHIHDFVMVLSKALCKHLGTQVSVFRHDHLSYSVRLDSS